MSGFARRHPHFGYTGIKDANGRHKAGHDEII
jgi:hypothetical protein